MAFRNKKERILEFDPEILVIQECENPELKGDWSEFSDWHWIGDNDNKGLGVFCRNGFQILETESNAITSRYLLPVRVSGNRNIVAVWAMNSDKEPSKRYIGQVYTGLRECSEFLDSDRVVAGDFNWNHIWDDNPSPSLVGNFQETVHLLQERDLESTYHSFTDSKFGDEPDPTFFMHKKRDRGYHIDYLFANSSRIDDLFVGGYDDWIEYSDHMPMITKMG